MDNRDLEKDKLNTEQEPKESVSETKTETETPTENETAAQIADQEQTVQPVSVEMDNQADVLPVKNREQGETDFDAEGASPTPDNQADEDSEEADEAEADAVDSNEEEAETKVYSAASPSSSESTNREEDSVDLSEDTIIHHAPLHRSKAQSRSNGQALSDTEDDTDKDAADSSEAEESEKETRDERRKQRKQRRKERIRLIPVWLRVLIVLLLCAASLVAGLMFGYGVVGEGTPTDILKQETWEHIIKIASGAE